MVELQARDLEVLGSNLGPGSNISLEFKFVFIFIIKHNHMVYFEKQY